MIIVFAWACKAQLNGRSLVHAEGPPLVARGMLEQAELDAIGEQAGWQPYYCLDVLRAVMSEAWRREGGTTLPSEATRTSAYLALESLYVELAKAIGGAIRVKATGLPSSYDNFLYLLVGIFFVVAPLAWGNVAGWCTPVICTVVFIVIRTLMVRRARASGARARATRAGRQGGDGCTHCPPPALAAGAGRCARGSIRGRHHRPPARQVL